MGSRGRGRGGEDEKGKEWGWAGGMDGGSASRIPANQKLFSILKNIKGTKDVAREGALEGRWRRVSAHPFTAPASLFHTTHSVSAFNLSLLAAF
jgi:hypothetical protein